MRHAAAFLAFVLAASAFAATTQNDDSCEISVRPAATLLLPYFEVDVKAGSVTTLFTVTNVSAMPQVAHVTLWTDWGYPGLMFNIFLTGYDVQGIDLYDVFANGLIAPPRGTSSFGEVPQNYPDSAQPAPNNGNPHLVNLNLCTNLPGRFSDALRADLQLMFTTGIVGGYYSSSSCTTKVVGGKHANVVGYATIDVVATCTTCTVTSKDYVDELLYDNVLTGDYQVVAPRGDKSYALGGPLVHIRAVPEGGAAGSVVAGTLPHTFYDRYTKTDRRQPLPSTFAARVIEGGNGGFNSTLKIWREGYPASACGDYARNAVVPFADVVRFDEHENAMIIGPPPFELPLTPQATPLTVSVRSGNPLFPPVPYPPSGSDPAGWLYLNLNSEATTARASQSWVVVDMFAEPTYAMEMPALAFDNGCAPATKYRAPIGPAPTP
jgi:hypothetical protein